MCQTNSKSLNKKSHIGYRVYRQNNNRSPILSVYNGNLKPRNNRPIDARHDPFHAFYQAIDLKKWLKRGNIFEDLHI